MNLRAARALLVGLVVLTAGCPGLSDTDVDRSTVTPAPVPEGETPDQVVTPTPTETETAVATPIPTTSLDPRDPADRAEAFDRLSALFRVNATQPTVHLSETPIERTNAPIDVPNRFEETMGLRPAVAPNTSIGTVSDDGLNVTLVTGVVSNGELERRLAYLYSRSLQRQMGWTEPLSAHRNGSVDQQTLAFLLTRSGAVIGADTYATALDVNATAVDPLNRSLGEGWLTREAVRAGYDELRQRYQLSPFYFSAFRDPPNTTEQFLDGTSPAYDPVRPLTVSTDVSDRWTIDTRDTLGQLALRGALASRLDRETVTDGVDHWGNDRLLVVSSADRSDDSGGFVLATTWDRPAYANQFATTLNRYVDRLAGDTTDQFRVVGPSNETVVLVAGDEPFVDATTVEAENGILSVSIGE